MIACVRMPCFAAVVEARHTSQAAERPQIIVRYTATGRGKVSACCARAERAGVTVGMLAVRALALCPEAQLIPLNAARIRRALHEVQMLLSAYSQWIEVEQDSLQSACVYVDLGKLRAAEGRQVAGQIVQRLSERLGLPAAVGLAATPFTAYAAAQEADVDAVVLVMPGEESAFLAPLPVSLLGLEHETARRLDLFGLVTLGQVAAIPRAALLEQFGKTGAQMHRLATGEDKRRIARYTPPESEQAALSFDPPLEDRQIVNRALSRLAGEVAQRLAARGLTCREITLSIQLADGATQDDLRRLRQPVSERVALERSLRAGLERLVLHAGISQISVEIGRLRAQMPEQLTLFETPGTAQLDEVVIELVARYGDERFYTTALSTRRALLPEQGFHIDAVEVA